MVSVIIPVFNAKKFLRRCLDSVIIQTYKDIEIIIIDDGSTDGSSIICDEYAEKDERFHVTHQENKGISVARQIGLNQVSGDYVVFVDADDWIEKEMVASMLDFAINKNADVVICDYYSEHSLNREKTYHKLPEHPTIQEYLQLFIEGRICVALWNKMFKASSLGSVNFYPSRLNYAEDYLFTIRLLTKQKLNLFYYPSAFYHYRINQSSVTKSRNCEMMTDRIIVVNELENILSSDFNNSISSVKRHYLEDFFVCRQFSFLNEFREIHQELLDKGKHYNFRFPLISCLTIALRGKPHLAYFFYFINMKIIKIKESVAAIVKKCIFYKSMIFSNRF